MGIYNYQDFRNNPVEYCGTEITDTPIDLQDINANDNINNDS